MQGTRRRQAGAVAVVAALVCGWASLGLAEDEPRGLALRIVSLKASGERADGGRPRADPSARPYLPALKALGYDHYRGAQSAVQQAAPGKPLVFAEGLPLDLQARAVWSAEGETLRLELSVDGPGKTPEAPRRKVVSATVSARSGQHFVLRVSDAYPDGDLVLLLTARRAQP